MMTLFGFYRTYEELKHIYAVGMTVKIPPFLSYLWGIETLYIQYRNANRRSFYRTYEELKPGGYILWNLKQFEFLSYLWGIETGLGCYICRSIWCVFIVPMRNWNDHPLNIDNAREFLFLSYLWGIETCPTPPFTAGESNVFIVPMRNWNPPGRVTVNDGGSVFIVPMRNWNLWLIDLVPTPEIVVFIVPMRNWNDENTELYVAQLVVFIVPMRNWNPLQSYSW